MTKVSGPRFTSSEITKLSDMFNGCAQITNFVLTYFNTRYVQYMDGMFEDCKKLTKIEINKEIFTTKNVFSTARMFSGCNELASFDLSGFVTDQVKSMDRMFVSCNKITSFDISNFASDNVVNTYQMFSSCQNLQSIKFGRQFTAINVMFMNEMFSNNKQLKSLD